MNTQSSRKIGVGIIGVGNWGRYGHIPVLRLLPNYEIVAVARRREEYGKQLANEFGIPHVFREPAELAYDQAKVSEAAVMVAMDSKARASLRGQL